MIKSNKSNITTVTSGKNQSITWGTKSAINFSSEFRLNGGGSFSNSVGSITDFAGASRQLWSLGAVLNYDLKDVYRYHLRGITSVGRNTAMKHQNYFYATAGFDPDMDQDAKKFLSRLELSSYRYQITNYVLKAMNLTYKLVNLADLVNEKVIRQPAATWTDSTREALERGTSGVVYAIANLRTLNSLAETGWNLSGFQKNFPRRDFQPHALAQISGTKGVFLGAQYQNATREGERTTAALYLDNMIRLRASSTTAENASNIFYPRDVQPQSSMKPWDWISPDKVISEIKLRYGKEPTEYAEFNGFKVPVDSSVDISPAGIDSYSTSITSQAQSHVQQSVTKAALEYKIAKTLADEIAVKLEIAKKQVLEIQGVEGDDVVPLTPAEMALAPLVAASKVANASQKAFLLAEATLLMNKLFLEHAEAELIANQKKLSADMPAAKALSALKTNASFFELSHESGQKKIDVKGSSDGLQLRSHDTEILMQDKWTSLTVDNGKAGLVVMPDDILLGMGDSGLNLASASVTLKGGGSEIKLANSCVTIGELKITQVGGKTKLNLLDQSEEKITKLEKKFETLQRALSQSIEDKDKEIIALKEQLSNLGNASKSKKKKK